jgi:hypothetical protein
VTARDGTPSRVSAVYQAPARDSFVLALKDAPEIWEVATDRDAPPVHAGFVHSHEAGMEEAVGAEAGLFAVRRIPVSEPLDDFFFTPDYRHLIGASRAGDRGVVVNLTVGREIAELPLPGMPHLGSGITWQWTDGEGRARTVMASTNLKAAEVTVIDMQSWEVLRRIPTRGPGFFLRSHAASRYAFVDSMMSREARHILQVIDKQTLAVVKEIAGEPGKTLAHVEFTRDGRHALASLWEDDGAIVVFDAQTLEEVKRLPMRKPVGKYNVWNKITRDEGTSH